MFGFALKPAAIAPAAARCVLRLAAVFALALPMTAPARAAEELLPAAQWSVIKDAVGAQLRALRQGDAQEAFSFAAPAIREQFGTAENFLRMVRSAYGLLLSARRTEFLVGAVIDGIVIQPVRLISGDDTVKVALYTMQKQSDGAWKINGCVLAPSTIRST